jgi:hypothetical protein
MVSRYRQPALTTPRRTLKRQAEFLRALLLALLTGLTGAAAADHSPPLRPYTAHYKASARGMDLDITRTLEASEDGRYVLTSGGKVLVVGFQEISVFRIEAGSIRPLSYVYQNTGLVSRRKELHFPPDRGVIRSLYKGRWYELPYADNTLDRMSQLEQLRLALMADPAGARDVTLRVADGKRAKDSRLVLVGNETLQTPLGAVDTVHYARLHASAQRKSDFWFAPEWDYLLVRTVHVENGDPVEMTLSGAILGGEIVGSH